MNTTLTTVFGIHSVNGTLSGENVNLVNSPQLIREGEREGKIQRDLPGLVHSRRVIDNNISRQEMARNLMDRNEGARWKSQSLIHSKFHI